MKTFVIILSLMTVSLSAFAMTSMSCRVGVHRAIEFIEGSGANPTSSVQMLRLSLVENRGEQEFKVMGETVRIQAFRFEHTDLYKLSVFLETPVVDLPTTGSPVARTVDHIFNDGPANQDIQDLNSVVKATRFSFLERRAGTFGMSLKLVTALRNAGKFGIGNFTSIILALNNWTDIADFVTEQVKVGTLKSTDVIGISLSNNCILED
jgi:hypothetical protein